MEKFLGVLFCGGKGTRLGEITKYISKCFVPIYDRPVFKYGLELLEKSKYIDEIIILTNNENNEKLKQTGYKTIIQDDNLVFDMFSGWEYLKRVTKTNKNGILMPSDNISDVNINYLIEIFNKYNTDLVFSLFEINDIEKLKQMGCYDIDNGNFVYKPFSPPSRYGVIAPYIVRNSLNTNEGDKILNKSKISFQTHTGYWFDIGDFNSIIEIYMSNFFKKINER